MAKVEYPYRCVGNPNRELSGPGSLRLSQRQRVFDHSIGVTDDPGIDANFVSTVGKQSGVVGGQSSMISGPSLYVSKRNCNPPTSNLEKADQSLFGSGLPKDYENSPPVPISLPMLRIWAAANKPPDPSWDSERQNTSPDCTVGILRRRDNGKISGWIPCGAWFCPVCGVAKKKRLTEKTVAAFADQPVCFLTLNPRVPSGKHKITDLNPMYSGGYRIEGYVPQENISACFARFRAILHKKGYFTGATGEITKETSYVNFKGTHCTRVTRARLPTDQAYFCVKEFSPPSHVKGGVVTVGHRRHYHILTSFYIPEDVVRDAWWRATNKTSTNVKMIAETEDYGVLRPSYITKYISRSMGDDTLVVDYLPHERRYTRSVGFFTLAFPSLGLCFYQGLVNSSFAYNQAVRAPDELPRHFSRQRPLA